MSFKALSITAVAAMLLVAGSAQAQNRFANGSFEVGQTTVPADPLPVANVDPTNAQGWLDAASGYSRSNDAHTGSFSALLTCPGLCAAVMLQNSVATGAMPNLVAGDLLTLSFWAKGNVGATGNVLFALRYLASGGGILYDSQNQFFQGAINSTTWSQITFNAPAVPVGATGAFLEFSTATGPGATSVLIDDVSLVPEPGTYAMMLAGMAFVGGIAARRRRAAAV
jgi:PEP-CTERM motif